MDNAVPGRLPRYVQERLDAGEREFRLVLTDEDRQAAHLLAEQLRRQGLSVRITRSALEVAPAPTQRHLERGRRPV